jgi:cleavage and polyadenylation specificity factor subunit 1
LTIRSVFKEDLGCTAAELVYGTTLCLLGDLLHCGTPTDVASSTYAGRLRKYMADFRPTPMRQHTGHPQVPRDLHTSSHVFVRRDAPRRPRQTPYTDLYRVVLRSETFLALDVNGRQDAVSIDRLKLAHLDPIS